MKLGAQVTSVNRAFFIAVSLEDGFYLKLAEFSGLRSLRRSLGVRVRDGEGRMAASR